MKVLFATDYFENYELYEVESEENIEELKEYWKECQAGEEPELPEGVKSLGTEQELLFSELPEECVNNPVYVYEFLESEEE